MLSLLNKFIMIIMLFTACSNLEKIQFEPDPYVGDYLNGGIVNSSGNFISAFEKTFNEYGCFHQDDFKRLAAILSAARIPKKYKKTLQKELDKINQKRKRALNQGR
jgi:hypothetical protein